MIVHNRSFIDDSNYVKRKENYSIEMDLHLKIPNPELLEFQGKSRFDKLAEVMGDRNVLWWLIPVFRLDPKEFSIEMELNQFVMK